MTRFILRRLAIIPVALLLVNFLGYAYAHLSLPIRASRIPYLAAQTSSEPLLPAYSSYLQDGLRLEFGLLPGGEETIATTISDAVPASLGLLALALALSVFVGLLLGERAVRSEPRGISRWLTLLSTAGLAMPSFYIGSLLLMAAFLYILRRKTGAPLPMYGSAWDLHLVLPTLALMARPTVQIAQVTATLLEGELGKRYVVAARSVGHSWRAIRLRYALRNVLAPVILMIAGSFRLLMGELILVERLFNWPGLGRLFAMSLVPGWSSTGLGSPLFLNPPVVATVLTAFAALFLVTDLIAAILVRVVDPRLRAEEEGTTGSADVASSYSVSARRNWPLILGGLIVLFIVVISIAGPALAPQDPLEEHTIIQVGDGWETAPFPAFTIPGFFLGSDLRGRDLLSRLLWAVRPTMTMIAVIASVRLVMGTLIGLLSGWFTGRPGRLLDAAISGALTVPVLMVALGAIAAVGIEIGLLAFIIGLSVTGWAETARIVREQTRLVKGQQYIEAARALGQSDWQILLQHVLRQVMPMVWMLFALEISSTLMTTASLGFLGYYIGGNVWVEVEDFVARRMSGMPELGQMLATADSGLLRLVQTLPWGMVTVGSLIFLIVLGFNLLGEGMRRRLSPERMRRRTAFSLAARRVGPWMEDRVLRPVAIWVRGHAIHVAVSVLLLLIAGGGLAWWRAWAARKPEEPAVILEIPGGHLWATEGRDPQRTRWSEARGPANPEVRWVFEDPAGFSGGPAVAADGTVYVASKGGTLYALDADGGILWQTSLSAAAVGAPALDAQGNIYVADREAGLSAFAPDGAFRWRFQSEGGSLAVAGPTVASDGTIYYPVGSSMQAVSPDGASLWMTRAASDYRVSSPSLDPAEELLFWQEVVFDARNGALQDFEMPVDADQYVTGADGRTYLRAGHNVMRWRQSALGVEIIEGTRWDSRRLGTFTTPVDAGVTRDQVVWLFYTNPYEATRVVWLDTEGRVMGVVRYPVGHGQMIAIDLDSTVYVCGTRNPRSISHSSSECAAFTPGSEEPVWQLPLEQGDLAQGGAMAPGRLYVTFGGVGGGFLYAIGE